MSIELKKHNEAAYKKIQEAFKKSDKVAVIHPTGTGKSFLALKFIEDNKDKKAIYVAPSNAILHNIKKSILDSDMDMTDLPKLKRVLYQGLMNLSDEEIEKLDYDIIILDEFHHCGAPEWGNGVDRLLMRNPEAQVLGLSATPIRYFDKSRNMAEELFGDNIASEMSLEEAINEGILPKAKYVSALYGYSEDLEKMKSNIEKIKDPDKRQLAQEMFERLSKKLDENTKNLPTLLSEHMTNKNGKYIVFCKNIEDMNEKLEQVQAIFGDVSPNIKTYAVSSQMKENDKMLSDFENDNSEDKLKLMFAVDMLNEGYHINDLDGVVMMRPTYSPTIYAQQLGRALTVKSEDEKEPVVIDLVNNFDSIKIIEDLYERLSVYEANNEKNDNNIEKSKISIYDTTKEFREIAQKITELTTEDRRNKIPLQEKIEIFERFLATGEEINGQTIYEGYPIGQWATQIRSAIKNGRNTVNLTEPQYEKLSKLGILDRRIENTIDEKIDTIIEWVQAHPGIPITRADIYKSKDRSLLYKLKEFAGDDKESFNEILKEYKTIQRYYDYVCIRHGKGKLTEPQINKCKEANIGERFGVPDDILDFSKKHNIELEVVMDVYKEFGSYDNFISLYKEGKLSDVQMKRYNNSLINNIIDVDFSPNSENYLELLNDIVGGGIADNNNLNIFSSKAIDRALQNLDEMDQEIIRERYGLIDGKTKTLEEIGSKFNVSRNAIRQRETKQLRHFRHPNKLNRFRAINVEELVEDKYLYDADKKELQELIDDFWKSELSFRHSRSIDNYLGEDELNKFTERIYNLDIIRQKWRLDEDKDKKVMERVSEQGLEVIEDPSRIHITDLNFSVRTFNCLNRAGIITLEDLSNKTYEEIKELRNLGLRSEKEIRSTLHKLGIILKEDAKEKDKLDKYINGEIDASEVTIYDLDLPKRAEPALYRTPIKTLEDLINTSEEELMQVKKLGNVTVKEIINRLKQIELLKEQANKVNGDTEKTEEANNSIAKESEEKIMDNINEKNENIVEEIDPEEYIQEWKESGEESYYTYLFNKYKSEKANGNEELAAHIYKVYEEAHELEQQWMGAADEEKMGDIEREKKKQREDLEREDSINSYPEEPEEVKSDVETEEKADLGDKTIEELEAIIAENEGTIAGNDKEIKDRLIQKILNQQQTIAKQQEEIDRLKSQKVIK